MARNKLVATGKRFGSRYGRRNRDKVAVLENQARTLYDCPSCGYKKVKRLAVGIWFCHKCGNKFASKAYQVTASPVLRSRSEESIYG